MYESFKDAAIPLGLVEDDFIWIECMKEHHDWQTNIHHICQLFATIIAKCEVNKNKTFYKICKKYLYTDFMHTYKLEFPKHSEDVVEDDKVVLETYEEDDEWKMEKFASNSSLCDLERILAKEGLSLKNFSLPVPNMEKEEFIQDCLQVDHDIAEENDLSVEKVKIFYKASYPLLNENQQQVFNFIKNLIFGKQGWVVEFS